MLEDNLFKTQLRNDRQQERLGENPACVRCGFSKPAALTLKSRSWLEKHHVFLKANDSRTMVPLCLNCHRIVTDAAYAAGAMHPASTCPERFQMMLRSLGSFLIVLGERLLEWAEEVAAFIRGLDANHPGWRQMPEAK
jgi:hypothetical protein